MICVLAEFSLNDNGINSSFCTNIEFEPILHYTELMMIFLSTWGVVPHEVFIFNHMTQFRKKKQINKLNYFSNICFIEFNP